MFWKYGESVCVCVYVIRGIVSNRSPRKLKSSSYLENRFCGFNRSFCSNINELYSGWPNADISRLKCPVLSFIQRGVSCYCFKESLLKKPLVTGICHFHELLKFGKITGIRVGHIYKSQESSEVHFSTICSIWLTLADRRSCIFQNKDLRILVFFS